MIFLSSTYLTVSQKVCLHGSVRPKQHIPGRSGQVGQERLTNELTKRLDLIGRTDDGHDPTALRNGTAVITGDRGIGKSVVLADGAVGTRK